MRTPSKTDVPVTGDIGRPLSSSSFQFSTRDLLIATTIISVVLAIGVPFGGFAIVAVMIGVLQAIILLAGACVYDRNLVDHSRNWINNSRNQYGGTSD